MIVETLVAFTAEIPHSLNPGIGNQREFGNFPKVRGVVIGWNFLEWLTGLYWIPMVTVTRGFRTERQNKSISQHSVWFAPTRKLYIGLCDTNYWMKLLYYWGKDKQFIPNMRQLKGHRSSGAVFYNTLLHFTPATLRMPRLQCIHIYSRTFLLFLTL